MKYWDYENSEIMIFEHSTLQFSFVSLSGEAEGYVVVARVASSSYIEEGGPEPLHGHSHVRDSPQEHLSIQVFSQVVMQTTFYQLLASNELLVLQLSTVNN